MQYIQDLIAVKSKCDRIKGLQKMISGGLTIPSPVKILTPQAFLDYKKSGSLSTELVKQIKSAFKEIRMCNPSRGVYAGRAYFVPGLNQPPGPRSSSVTDDNVIIGEVEKLFEFAKKNEFDVKGSEIGVIFYPFINPTMPFGGGCVTPVLNNKQHCLIEYIFGNDEGVQSFPHDSYLVDFSKAKIIKKQIDKKTEYLQATTQFGYETQVVPDEYRNKQLLNDENIIGISKQYNTFFNTFGSHRLEFALQKEGVFFRECTPFQEVARSSQDLHITGEVVAIKKTKDIQKILRKHNILFIDPTIIQKRNMDLLTGLAFSVKHKKIILYPGTASTAHAATILRERGHTLVFVGNQKYQTGQRVKIDIVNADFKVEVLP